VNPNVVLNLANRIEVKLVIVALSRQILDAGYWMLDIQERTDSEI